MLRTNSVDVCVINVFHQLHFPLWGSTGCEGSEFLQQTMPVAVPARPVPSSSRAGVRAAPRTQTAALRYHSNSTPMSDCSDGTGSLSQWPHRQKQAYKGNTYQALINQCFVSLLTFSKTNTVNNVASFLFASSILLETQLHRQKQSSWLQWTDLCFQEPERQ